MYEVMLLFSLLSWLAVNTVFARSPAFNIFHPFMTYTCFHGFIFVIRPIFAYFLEYRLVYSVYDFIPNVEEKTFALAVANVGYFSYAFFSLRAGNAALVFRDHAAREPEMRELSRVLPIAAAIIAPIAIYSLWYSVNAAASGNAYAGMQQDAATRITINTTGNGYLEDSKLFLVPLCAVIAWLGRFRIYSLLPLALFVVMKAATGGRGPFVVAAVVTACFYFYDKKLKLPNPRMVAAAAALFVVFGAVGADRGASIRDMLGLGDQQTAAIESQFELKPLEGMDFANMEYLEYITSTIPAKTGTYDYFLGNLQVFTEGIPRSLWKNKPIGAPIKMYDLFQFGNPVGMTSSLPGMGWAQFGWAGVIFWCGLWGWLTGLWYQRFATGRQDPFAVALYIVSLPILIIAFRDGGLVTIVHLGAFYLLPVLLLGAFRRLNRAIDPVAMLNYGSAAGELSLSPAEKRRRRAREPG
jgi:hypothetical protein